MAYEFFDKTISDYLLLRNERKEKIELWKKTEGELEVVLNKINEGKLCPHCGNNQILHGCFCQKDE